MRAADNPRFRRVWWPMFSQGGKSSGLFGVAGHRLDDKPAPVLYIGPTRTNVQMVIEPKLDHMLRSTPSLWEKTARGKKYTKLLKLVAGVGLRLAWAGSSTELSADPACLVLVDEIDRMNRDIKGEGSVVELADARHSTYWDGTTFGVSSPTEGNLDTYIDERTGLEHWDISDTVLSPIWVLWQEGTRHEWAWPCPECFEYFIPRLKLLWWPGKVERDEASPAEAMQKAGLTCLHCGSLIQSDRKPWMNARGVYVMPGQRPLAHRAGRDDCAHIADYNEGEIVRRRGARNVHQVEFGDFYVGDDAFVDDASFWCSGLANFSAKKSWGAQASRYLKAQRSGDPERLKGVVNTEFGECFRFGGEAPDLDAIKARKSAYKGGELPAGVLFLTCGVDVGKRQLDYCIRGWGEGFESWLIEDGELDGATNKSEVWDKLEEVLDDDYGGLSIRLMGVDAGYRKDEVGAFVRKHKSICRATRGRQTLDRPYYASSVDVKVNGKTYPKGLKFWHFDTDRMKSWVHGRIEVGDDEIGAWHLPGDVSDDYCRQICAEERIGDGKWKRIGPNHKLDCEAVNRLLALMAKRSIRKLARKKSHSEERDDEESSSETTEQSSQRRKTARPRKKSWATNWR